MQSLPLDALGLRFKWDPKEQDTPKGGEKNGTVRVGERSHNPGSRRACHGSESPRGDPRVVCVVDFQKVHSHLPPWSRVSGDPIVVWWGLSSIGGRDAHPGEGRVEFHPLRDGRWDEGVEGWGAKAANQYQTF